MSKYITEDMFINIFRKKITAIELINPENTLIKFHLEDGSTLLLHSESQITFKYSDKE